MACDIDKQRISKVLIAAFGTEKRNEITDNVASLLADPSAQPSLSLVAAVNDHVVGYILITKARIRHFRQIEASVILATLSVHPKYQNQGIGGRINKEGLKHLKTIVIDLVFVLGHPTDYSTYGFAPAKRSGFVHHARYCLKI